MSKFMLLHFGFEKPTPQIMQAWQTWFETVAEHTVENGGFHGAARELNKAGSEDLTMGPESITGYSIIEANDIDHAEQLASTNPFIKAIRIYEIK